MRIFGYHQLNLSGLDTHDNPPDSTPRAHTFPSMSCPISTPSPSQGDRIHGSDDLECVDEPLDWHPLQQSTPHSGSSSEPTAATNDKPERFVLDNAAGLISSRFRMYAALPCTVDGSLRLRHSTLKRPARRLWLCNRSTRRANPRPRQRLFQQWPRFDIDKASIAETLQLNDLI